MSDFTHRLCVRGITYRQEEASLVQVGDQVGFIPEPDNPHDPNAIAILTLSQGSWQKIGYVPKELTSYVRPLLPGDELYSYPGATVSEVNRDGGAITVWVAFPSDRDMPRQTPLRSHSPECQPCVFTAEG
jgi:hypothetical protein